jgi:hypothetical protein
VITSGELEWTGQEAVIAYFEILSSHSSGVTKKNLRKLVM